MIIRINNRARHMLGGISDQVPFAWPKETSFLDVETMHPLEGSHIEIRARPVSAPSKELEALQQSPGARPSDDASYRYVEINVVDNGLGMDEETLARCIDPFFTTKDSNSGLGLAMVYGDRI